MPALNQSQLDVLRAYVVGVKVGPKASTAYTTTVPQLLFTVVGGKVLVRLLLATVSTIHASATQNIKTQTAPTAGTAVVLSSDVDTNALEAGGTIVSRGDGSASVKANGGVVLNATIPGNTGFVVSPGGISFTPSATQAGATNWELWYVPLDDGAYVTTA